MTPTKWSAVGYASTTPDDLFVLPVFRREDDPDRRFAQFTYSSTSGVVELKPVSTESLTSISPIAVKDPETIRYLAIKLNGSVSVIEPNELSSLLPAVEIKKLSKSSLIQMIGLTDALGIDLPSDFKIAVEQDDFAFLPTLSAQSFIENALRNVGSTKPYDVVAREVLYCSHWVTDWNIRSLPEERLSSLMSNLAIDTEGLQRLVDDAKARIESYLDVEIVPRQRALRAPEKLDIRGLRRQELRIAAFLRNIVVDPIKAEGVLGSYDAQTKYEFLVLPYIVDALRNSVGQSIETREVIVARCIRRIFIKFFPIRRGVFLADLVRLLGDFPIVFEDLQRMYREKGFTYGMRIHAEQLQKLIMYPNQSETIWLRKALEA